MTACHTISFRRGCLLPHKSGVALRLPPHSKALRASSYPAYGTANLETIQWMRYRRRRMKEWFQLAFRPSVVKRALKYALIVGFILIAINHSDAILSGQVTRGRLLKMLLTVLVPYVVSTLSSVGVLLEMRRKP
jgi:hypothetical protein